MSTFGRPVSQVMVRSASRSASRWTASISRSSSRSLRLRVGVLALLARLVVKPFTSSPAMPMITWLERKPAISSASWSATWQLSTTAAMSATVPDCMCASPWRLRPTPRTVSPCRRRRSRTRAPWRTRSRHRAPCTRPAARSPLAAESGARRPCVFSRCWVALSGAVAQPRSSASRIASRALGSRSRRVPRAWAISGRPPPRPSITGAPWLTSAPAETPRATRSSLTVTKSCGSSASSASAMTPSPSSARSARAKLCSSFIESNGAE